jgi:aminoglycoside 6'-N-acetyltransferase
VSENGVEVRALDVALEPFAWSSCGELLSAWLRRPHVQRWWRETGHWLEQIRTTAAKDHAIITVSGRPVGYIRWQPVSRRILDELGLFEIPSGGADIDLFLGEPEWLGRGVGPTALRLLLARLGDDGVPLAGLCPSVENFVAIRAFEKAGFGKLREFNDPSVGQCWVLTIELTPSKQALE